jgi:hypothetical protein
VYAKGDRLLQDATMACLAASVASGAAAAQLAAPKSHLEALPRSVKQLRSAYLQCVRSSDVHQVGGSGVPCRCFCCSPLEHQ